MIIDRNYTADPIEDLYEGVQEIGTREQRARGAELLSEHDVAVEQEECNKIRQKMLVLLATADWNYQFTPPAEARRREIFRKNFGRAA